MNESLHPGVPGNSKCFMLGLKDFLIRPKIKSHKIIKHCKYYIVETKKMVEDKSI